MDDIPDDVIEVARVLNMRLHSATELGQRTQWIAEALMAERERSSQLLSEADKREREARAKALEEAAAYHDDLAAQHAASHEHVVCDHHEMMERQHTRFAAAIRALKSEER